MTEDLTAAEPTVPTHCEHCGEELKSAVVDLDKGNEDRPAFNPGEMVAVAFCANDQCPGNAEVAGS